MAFSLTLLVVVTLAGCSTGPDSTGGASPANSTPATAGSTPTSDVGEMPSGERYPDVLDAELTSQDGGSYSVAVTISSPYDSPQQYADGWRVLTPEGKELGTHTLGHDHASEQPFTRTQSDLQIPSDVVAVTVEGRDTQNGYGGETVTVEVQRPSD